MKERLGTAAIVLFVLVDIVLVTLAFRHVQPVDPASSGDSLGGLSPSDPPSGTEPARSPTGGSSRPGGSGVEAGEGRIVMSMAEDGTLLRATSGSCADSVAPSVEVSVDTGETFERVPVGPALSQVVRVQADAADDLWLVGAGADCAELGVYRGGADTGAWELSPGTQGAWHLVPGSEASVAHAPDGEVELPCPPLDLATIPGGPPRVLCEDGTIVGTDDAGETWVVLGRLDGAVAVHYTSPSTGLGLATEVDCAAAVLETADGGASWERLTCLEGGEARALAGNGETVVAQTDRQLHLSTDGGVSWQAAG